ncbi:MAG: hypothetical protein JWN93_2239 [Hyphomicrobiales bacterium]|nr:hypothetical protein [Hyphomicrobiales bacterium]
MRRGLMAWDENELPRAALEERLASLRAQMRQQGLDAFVAYTNIARGAAVCWLSGFTPYWNEGLYFVPMEGEPIFATALSKRVAEWIGSVMPQGAVTTTPRPPALIAEHIARSGAKKIGVLELDGFPAGHAKVILEGAPGVELIDATDAFALARGGSDTSERALLVVADMLAGQGLSTIRPGQTSEARALIAPCDSAARLGGAEECFTTLAADLAQSAGFLRTDTVSALGETYAVRVSLAYKGVWTRRTRSFANDAATQAAFDTADAALASFAAPDGVPLDKALAAHFASLGTLANWTAEQPRGSYPLAPVANETGAAEGLSLDAPFVLSVELSLKGKRWIGARLIGA